MQIVSNMSRYQTRDLNSPFTNHHLFSNYYLGTLWKRDLTKRFGELHNHIPATIRRAMKSLWDRVSPTLSTPDYSMRNPLGSSLRITREKILNAFVDWLGYEPLETVHTSLFPALKEQSLPSGFFCYKAPVSVQQKKDLSSSAPLQASLFPQSEPENNDIPEEVWQDVDHDDDGDDSWDITEETGSADFTTEIEKIPGVLFSFLGWGVDFDRPFDSQKRRGDTPAKLMERLLASGPFQWGILANGTAFRLMRNSVLAGRQQYFEVDIEQLCESSNDDSFDQFWALFHARAFHPDEDGRCFLDIVDEESRQHALGVSASLKQSVYGALDRLMSALVDRARELASRTPLVTEAAEPQQLARQATLHATAQAALANIKGLYDESLTLLYRLLFLFYAESRRLLPIDQPIYRDSYSLEPMRQEVYTTERSYQPNRYAIWERFQALFRLIHNGCNVGEMVIPAYGGRLFDLKRTQYLNTLRLSDKVMADILRDLSETPAGQGRGRELIDYNDLGVEQLGSVYEGLLEFEPHRAREPMVEVRYKDNKVVIPEQNNLREDGSALYPVLRSFQPGDFYLGRGAGRKVTGSYYTPQPLVDFLVQRTLAPLIQGRSAEEILELKIVDPAMGSGAFLVGACLYLAQEYARALKAEQIAREALLVNDTTDTDEQIETPQTEDTSEFDLDIELDTEPEAIETMSEEDSRPYRRLVAERCLYGVDLNEMAVELAKVSLWLTTLAGDKPLTFLDANLRCGNSLVSAPLIPYQGPSGVEYTIERIHPEANKLLAKARGNASSGTRSKKKSSDMQLALWDEIGYSQVTPLLHLRRLIAAKPSDDVETVTEKERFLQELNERSERQTYQQLADLWVASWFWRQPPADPNKQEPGIHYSPFLDGHIYADMVQTIRNGEGLFYRDEKLAPCFQEVERITAEVKPFHWELEFPELYFTDDGTPKDLAGFDAVLGNPPWEKIKLSSQEFFSDYDPGFRELERLESEQRQHELLQDKYTLQSWQTHQQQLNAYVTFTRKSEAYPHQSVLVDGKMTASDANTYKLFLEKMYQILRPAGHGGIIIPSGLYNDKGCTGLRQLFLKQTQVNHLVCLENRKEIFPIHRSFKFVLFGFEKKRPEQSFEAAFMIQDLDTLSAFNEIKLFIPIDLIQRFSPVTLSIMEFRSQQDIDNISRIFSSHPLLGEISDNGWNMTIKREFHLTGNRGLFNQKGNGWPLYEGKMIHQYTHTFSQPNYWVEPDAGKKELTRLEIQRVEKRLDEIIKKQYSSNSKLSQKERVIAFLKQHGRDELTEKDICLDLERPRLGFRRVARNTDERSMIATIIPTNNFLVYTITHLIPWSFHADRAVRNVNDIKSCYQLSLNPYELTYLCGVFNSFSLDYILRFKITTDVNMFHVYQLPVPRLTEKDAHCRAIAKRVAKLVCVGEEFDELRADVLGSVDAEVLPFEEKERRQLVQNEIDALVAHLYGLNEDDLRHILYASYTFPLVKQEIKDGVMEAFARVESLFDGI